MRSCRLKPPFGFIAFAVFGSLTNAEATPPATAPAPQVEAIFLMPAKDMGWSEVSKDGKHIVVTVGDEKDAALWLDGIPIAKSLIGCTQPQLSENGLHVAYCTFTPDGNGSVFLDDKRIGEYAGVQGEPKLSADGKHIAFVISHDDQRSVVVDGQEGPKFDEVDSLTISADGLHVAYSAKTKDRVAVVLDGKSSDAYKDVRDITFSPDGSRLAYAFRNADDKWSAMIDDKAGPAYRAVSAFFFSTDSKHVGYGAALENKLGYTFIAHVDQKTTIVSRMLDGMSFSADGGRVVMRGIVPTGAPFAANHWPIHECLIIDGKEGPACSSIGLPTISADGAHLAYVANGSCVQLDDTSGKQYKKIGPPVFSPDGKHLAYAAFIDCGSKTVMIDEQPWEFPQFKAVMVLDGVEVLNYEPVTEYADPRQCYGFDNSGHLNFVATNDNKIYRVSVSP